MGKKNQSWCWRKGNRKYFSVSGVKGAYARELLYFEQIRINNVDRKRFKIWPYGSGGLGGLPTSRQSARLLESKGWKWIKYVEEYK